MAQYASLWCFMAMTRAIDTLYIKLSNTSNAFSQTILRVARSLPQVEILEGDYVNDEMNNPVQRRHSVRNRQYLCIVNKETNEIWQIERTIKHWENKPVYPLCLCYSQDNGLYIKRFTENEDSEELLYRPQGYSWVCQ